MIGTATSKNVVGEGNLACPQNLGSANLPDKVFLWNEQGTYVGYYFPNHQNKHFVGPQRFMGRHILEVLPEAIGECIWEAVRLAFDSKGIQTRTIELRLEGVPHKVEVKLIPSEGKVLGLANDYRL